MKRTLCALLSAVLVLLCIPAVSASQPPVELTLTTAVEEIETRHIQPLSLSVHNCEHQKRAVRLVAALVNYRGEVLSRSVTQLTLAENSTSASTQYLKPGSDAYEVLLYAEDENGSTLSNVLHIPVQGGYAVREIKAVEELFVTVPQWSSYTLPDTVTVTFYTGEQEQAAVVWNRQIDLSVTGMQRITGTVEGTDKPAVLVLTVLKADKIESIPALSITVEQNAPFTLPAAVAALTSSGTTEYLAAAWQGTASTAQPGTFAFTGKAAGQDVALTLTVLPADDSAVYTFRNSELADYAADVLGCGVNEITRGMLKTITSLNLYYGLWSSCDLEDLRFFTGLKTLSMPMIMTGDDCDLSPLADLPLESLDLYYSSDVTSIAPLFHLRTLRSLRLTGTGVEDFSPIGPCYEGMSAAGFALTPLDVDADGTAVLRIRAGEAQPMPFAVRLSDGSYAAVDWELREVPAQEDGTLTVRGTLIGSDKTISVTCVIADREDYAIEWKDAALEQAVRNAIDKPYGTVYYSDVKYLKELDAFAMGVRSLEDVEHLRSLTYLGVAANYLDDSQWQYISKLTKLQYLDIAMNQFTTLPAGALKDMPDLIELCADENSIVTIEPGAFRGQEDLKTLMLEENHGLSDISEVAKITGLEDLFIRETNVSDLSCLTGLNELTELWASDCPISDISPLAGKSRLYRVYLDNSKHEGRLTDISALAAADGLYWLAIDGNQISDLSALAGKAALMHLEADYNRIESLAPLSGCAALERAYLSNNRIADVSALSGLSKLSSLYLQNNRITDVKPLAQLTALKNLYLAGNPITDYSPLRGIYAQLIGKDFVV